MRPKALVSITDEEQMAHIKEHMAAFSGHVGRNRTVEDYFGDYNYTYEQDSGFGALYVCLCQDLQITPKGLIS